MSVVPSAEEPFAVETGRRALEDPGSPYDAARVEKAVREILLAIGEDPERDGLRDTPTRVARAYAEMFAGMWQDPKEVLTTTFDIGHDELVLVKDIEVFSQCVPSRQVVDAVGGRKRAADVRTGDQLWTLVNGAVVPTTVTSVDSRQAREVVEVSTEGGTFQVTADHPLATPQGWVEAEDVEGRFIEWTPTRKLCRERPTPRPGYDFDRDFAKKLAYSLHAATGLDAGAESVPRPSGSTGRDTPGYRVRVVSSYLPDLQRQYVGSDVGARFTPKPGGVSKLYVADSWFRKHGFHREDHRTDLLESRWVQVAKVRRLPATGAKPYTVYSFQCDPHPTFLVAGHLTHNCEHHLVPFHGVAHVGYIPAVDGRITGISKLARLVDAYARRPQVQERLTSQVADTLMEVLEPRGVIVVMECEHLCMSMRGVRRPGSRTVTSAMRGQLRDPASRAEALSLIHGR